MKSAILANPASELSLIEGLGGASLKFCKIGRTIKMHIFSVTDKYFYPIIVEKLSRFSPCAIIYFAQLRVCFVGWCKSIVKWKNISIYG